MASFKDENVNRRNFIIKLLSAFGALLGAAVTVPIIGAMVAPIYRRKPYLLNLKIPLPCPGRELLLKPHRGLDAYPGINLSLSR